MRRLLRPVLGALLGALLGKVAAAALSLLGFGLVDPLFLAVVGMSAFGTAIIGAPLAMTFMALETTGNFQVAGAVLSMVGVLLVLGQGDWRHLLALRLVPGDLYMMLATACWAFYSWLLVGTREPAGSR